jgi:hypothetical protein
MMMCLRRLVIAVSLLLLPALATAQNVATGTITGVVRDSSGGVLPGVTVEVSSPALIERVRTAVTDGQGVYRLIDLRPGAYTVTFTLSGFSTLRRLGIELTTGFTATVNADLAVGDLAETITVSGASPLVDTQSVSQQSVFDREVTENLPVGSTVNLYATLIPGANYSSGATSQDVGGSKGEFQQGFIIHGGRGSDFQQLREGMFFGTLVAAGNRMTSLNPATVAEVTVQTSSAMAEMESGGALINAVPRDGGNTFSGTFNGSGSAKSLQSDNVDDDLRARGVTSTPYLRKRYDVGGGVGGPIQQDRVWFFFSLRSWIASDFYPNNYFNATPGTLFYTPDLSRPVYDENRYREARFRATWQVTPKDKIVGMFGYEWNCNCPGSYALGATLRSPEAAVGSDYSPNWQNQVTWNRPATNRLLLEAGNVIVNGRLNLVQFAGSVADPSVTDSSRNYLYGSLSYGLGLNGSLGYNTFRQVNQKFALSYVTGSHSFKTGMQLMHGWRNAFFFMDPARNYSNYVFNGRVPTTVNYYAGPIGDQGRMRTLGIFAQDQWTISRLTLNLGLRFDYLNGRVPAQEFEAGTWVPARSFPEVKNVPNWEDVNPRVGAVYDLFGTGRTAIKGFLGRYVTFEPIGGIISQNSPVNLTVTTASRAWTDANGDYVPQESELGPLSNANFGRTERTTTFSDEVLTGHRPYSWQGSLQLQQELWPGVALNVGYFRTWYGNFRATDNQVLTPADFSPYCVTAPSNALLPNGGGNEICGMYDVVPSKFGQVDNLVTLSENFGGQTEVFNGVDVTMSARLGNGLFVQGGLATGATVTDTCAMNDKPDVLAQGSAASTPRTSEYCHVSPPWSAGTQFKAAVVYPLWWNLQASANYQNLAPISTPANAAYTNAAIAPSLGRNLAACGARVPCTSQAVVDIVLPNTHFTEPRLHQIDLRFSRIFRLSRGGTIQPQFDIYNVTNANSVLAINTRIGPVFNNATAILGARVLRFGVNMNF